MQSTDNPNKKRYRSTTSPDRDSRTSGMSSGSKRRKSSSSSSTIYSCKFCSNEYPDRNNRNTHQRHCKKNPKATVYKCPWCSACIGNPSNFKRHLISCSLRLEREVPTNIQ